MAEEVTIVENEEATALEPEHNNAGDEIAEGEQDFPEVAPITADSDMLETRLCNMVQADLVKLHIMLQSGAAMTAEMEGFWERVGNTIYNLFQGTYNNTKIWIESWIAMFKQDWQDYANRYIKWIFDNLPESEYFSGTICLRGNRMTVDKNKACLQACCNLINNISAELKSSENTAITRQIRNCSQYLEANHCTMDLSRPSKCKSATRFTYGEMGRLGTAGYGSDPAVFLSHMKRNLDLWGGFYNTFTDHNKIAKAIDDAESQISAEIRRMEGKNDVRSQEMLSERINNIKTRLTAFRAVMRASFDMWQVTLYTHIVLPVQNMAFGAGMKDDLFSWILATRD